MTTSRPGKEKCYVALGCSNHKIKNSKTNKEYMPKNKVKPKEPWAYGLNLAYSNNNNFTTC